ncbi:MAG: MFS transporter [Proteobacteria bacterium]|nr:MFS transporter [Pseudomonadota bacterium]
MLSNQFKFQYSVGAVANGIKTDMFTFFLLFFYSRVIGLDPLLASLAIGAALIVDSITDPLMGTISDRTNTKLGRRHPYMLVSFIPVSIFYILLFTPKPDWDITQNQLFWWMFVCASFTRIGMTLFEVPHRSFGAEITKDYVERTKLFSWREMFAWVAGISNAFLAYNIFFRSTPEYPYGQLNPESYFPLALTGAIFMVVSLLYSSITTTNKIENLSKWTEAVTLKQIIKELKIAISNKSDFWGLKGSQIGIFLYIYFGAAFLAFYITPKFVAIIGKRNFVLLCVLGVALSAPIAFISYNLGLTPEKGTTTLVLFLCVPLIFISTLSIAGNMARDAMIGDIADEVDLQSGKRQEGVLYSAVSFVQKVNTAIGSLTGGLTLWVLNITAETPTYDQAYSLFFVQGVIGPILLIIPILFFYFYSLDKKRHSEILRQLKERS